MKNLRTITLFLFCLFAISMYSQKRSLKVTTQFGWMRAGDLYAGEPKAAAVSDLGGHSIGADVCYFLTRRFFVGVHYNYGNMQYEANPMDSKSSTRYRESGGKTQADMEVLNVGLLVGYRLPISSSVSLTGQVGFAHFLSMDNSRRIEYVVDDRTEAGYYEHMSSETFNFSSASIPVKFALGYAPFAKSSNKLVRSLEISYACGWYIEPDFGFFTCLYHGPQLSFSF